MKTCPKCGAEHSKPGIFCSRKCANSRTFTEDTNIKKRTSQKRYLASLSDAEKKAYYDNRNGSMIERRVLSIFEKPFDEVHLQGKRRIVIVEQNGKCLHCGLSEWLGTTITFELDHINGNNKDHRRSNLRALCPNCHSQTDTWRGKSRGVWEGKLNKVMQLRNLSSKDK